MTSDVEGNIYLAGKDLYVYNIYTGVVEYKGGFPAGITSSGDLTFRNDSLFLAATNGSIVLVNVENPELSSVLFYYPDSLFLTGITTFFGGCDSLITIGASFTDFYLVDFANYQVLPLGCAVTPGTSTGIFGLGTLEEFQATTCDLELWLDRDSSTVHKWGVGSVGDYALLHCGLDAVGIVDSDVVIYSSQPIDSMRARLLWGDGFLEVSSWPSVLDVGVPSGEVLVWRDGGGATASDFEAALLQVELHANGADSFVVEVLVWSRYGQRDTSRSWIRVYEGAQEFSVGLEGDVCDSDTLWLSLPDTAWYAWGGQVWGEAIWDDGSTGAVRQVHASGTYWVRVDVEQASGGCAWSDTVEVVFDSPVEVYDTMRPCGGSAVELWGQWYAMDTTVCVLGQTWGGCDSLRCVTLDFLPVLEVDLDSSICAGEVVWIGEESYTQPGLYEVVLSGWGGCDSVVWLNLSVYVPDTTVWWGEFCSGEGFEWDGAWYDSAGTYVRHYESGVTGCDSVSILILEEVVVDTGWMEVELCEGDTMWIGDSWVVAGGIYSDTLQAWSGCDSVVYVEVVMRELDSSLLSVEVWLDSCGGRAQLSVSGWAEVLWNGSVWGSSIWVDTSGWYGVEGRDSAGCWMVDSVWLWLPRALSVEVAVSDPSCWGGLDGGVEVRVQGGVGPLQYSLSGVVSEQGVWTGLAGGGYVLRVEDGWGCVWEDSLWLAAGVDMGLEARGDTVIWRGDRVWMEAWADVAAQAVWWTPSTGLDCASCASTWAQPLETTRYTVWWQGADGCVDTAQVEIRVREWPEVYAPNVFSPNGDGVNERYMLYYGEGVEVLVLEVYSRWGGLVWRGGPFSSGMGASGWDGRWGDQAAPIDVYVWRALIRWPDGSTSWRAGSVTLLR